MSNSKPKAGDHPLPKKPLKELFAQSHDRGRAGLPLMSLSMGRGLVPRNQDERRVETNLGDEEHRLVRAGELVYNMMRMWQGVCSLAEEDCLVSPAYVVVRPLDGMYPQFSEYLLTYEETVAQFKHLSFGVVDDRLRLYYKDFERVQVRVPSKMVQRKIANILTTLDNLIAKTEALIAKQQVVQQGMMYDLFTRGLDEHGHLRLSHVEAPHLYRPSPLGLIPKSWKESTVAGEFSISTGFTLGLHRRPTRHIRKYLRVANVRRDEIRLDDLAELEASQEEFESRQLEENDLLVVEGHADPEQIGRCAIVSNDAAGLTFQNHLFRLRSLRMHPRFACDWLNSETARRYWLCRCATSSGLNTINQTMLKRLSCLVPLPEEQERIVDCSVALSSTIRKSITYLFKLGQLKSGLMHDLLSGKVRVQVDPAEEVADE